MTQAKGIEFYEPYEFTWCRDSEGYVWLCHYLEGSEGEFGWGSHCGPLCWRPEIWTDINQEELL